MVGYWNVLTGMHEIYERAVNHPHQLDIASKMKLYQHLEEERKRKELEEKRQDYSLKPEYIFPLTLK